MADNKTIGISSLISLGIVTLAMIVPGFFDEPSYYCNIRPEIGLVHCDDFKKYGDPNGECIRNDNTNLRCRTGWELVTDDLDDLPDENDISIETNLLQLHANTSSLICNLSTEGGIYYNGDDKEHYKCNSIEWVPLVISPEAYCKMPTLTSGVLTIQAPKIKLAGDTVDFIIH